MGNIISPKSETELSTIVREANASASTLEIRGGGTRPIGNPVAAQRIISTKGVSGISLYEPGALTIVARAGTELDKINSELAKENQHLPFEPADYSGLLGTSGQSTIGGVIAAAVSGPRRIQAGAARDALIGVRFVNAQGEIIKNGGRVMKNVTGYDLVKLMCGSHGTLGILSEVSFKVLPKPERTGGLLIYGLDDTTAVLVMSKALASPYDVSGAAHAQRGADGHSVTTIRVEGFERSVRYRTEKLKEMCSQYLDPEQDIHMEFGEETNRTHWQGIRDVKSFHERAGAVWKLSVKPTDGPRVVGALQTQMPLEAVYDWGGGLVWLLVDEEKNASETMIRKQVNAAGGHATLMRADEKVRNTVECFHPEPERIAEISRKLRRQFDPKGILNPGRMARNRELA